MKKFFKTLSGKTQKNSFKEIPLDRKATYKQQWAVAWRFARECADNFPYQSEKALAVIFNAVIYKYHSDPECNTELTHGDVQEYLSGEKSCPDYYKRLIHINLREELNKPEHKVKPKDSNNYNGHKSLDLSDEKQVQQFIKLYNEGENLANIGKVFGISKSSVRNYIQRLKDKGVDIDFRGQGSQSKTAKSFDVYDERKVRRFIRMYQDGYTLDVIGDTFGMSGASVRNYLQILKDKGVDIDFRGPGRRTANLYPDSKKKKRSVNLNNERSSNKKLLNLMNNQKRS